MLDDSTLKALAEFPEKLKNFYNAVPNDRKDWAPEFWDGVPSETLTAIEQICHIRDVEIDGYHSRFERTLRGTNPVLESLDTYELAVQTKLHEGKCRRGSFRVQPSTAEDRTAVIVSHGGPAKSDRCLRWLRTSDSSRPGALSLQSRSAAPLRSAMAAGKD
jgi:hypothetical protein